MKSKNSFFKRYLGKNLSILAVICMIAACGGSSSPARDGRDTRDGSIRAPGTKIKVVTTIAQIADAARRIAGEHADVTSLMGPGVDPHLYKATESDVNRLTSSDLILYNGLHLEGKMADVLVKIARERPVVAVSESIEESDLREPPEFAGQYDPHIWFDVRLWSLTIDVIAKELGKLDPQNAELFMMNAAVYRHELDELDQEVIKQIAAIPESRRVLVTAHDAFGYFGDRYGIEVIGLQGISTSTEAGLHDVERVASVIADRGIPAIFVESSVPRKTIEAVQAAVRAKGGEVVIGGELFSDAMGQPGTAEGTYIGMVTHNAHTIVGSLQ